jgi:hypothetical protein
MTPSRCRSVDVVPADASGMAYLMEQKEQAERAALGACDFRYA